MVFLIAGNDGNQDHVVIVEVKQWENIEKVDAIVRTYLGKANRETTHPSHQAWSYAALIEDFDENVQNKEIQLKLCAYYIPGTLFILTFQWDKPHII